MTPRSRNGEARPTTDEATMMATTPRTDQRYGVNSRAIRRSETSRACCFSAALGRSGVRNRPRPGFVGAVSPCRTSFGRLGEADAEVASS